MLSLRTAFGGAHSWALRIGDPGTSIAGAVETAADPAVTAGAGEFGADVVIAGETLLGEIPSK